MEECVTVPDGSACPRQAVRVVTEHFFWWSGKSPSPAHEGIKWFKCAGCHKLQQAEADGSWLSWFRVRLALPASVALCSSAWCQVSYRNETNDLQRLPFLLNAEFYTQAGGCMFWGIPFRTCRHGWIGYDVSAGSCSHFTSAQLCVGWDFSTQIKNEWQLFKVLIKLYMLLCICLMPKWMKAFLT